MMEKCPYCGSEVVIEEDWALGRVIRCGTHYRRVDRFDGSGKNEQEKRNDAA